MASGELNKRVAVLGWYGHGNIGDEAFKDSFRHLWNYQFDFFDHTPINWKSYDAIMVGGGSLVDAKWDGLAWLDKPIGFIGIGTGKEIHPENVVAMNKAKIVLTRNHSNWIKCPDLVFARKLSSDLTKKNKVVILLNNHFCPHSKAARWHDLAWDWFVSEFSQWLDIFIDENGCDVHFVSMCKNAVEDDLRASAYVIDKMRNRRSVRVFDNCSEEMVLSEIASARLVATQRFHGMVYATMLGVPFIGICGHAKLTDFVKELGWNGAVPYYGLTVDGLRKAAMLDDSKILLNYSQRALDAWKGLSELVDQELFG